MLMVANQKYYNTERGEGGRVSVLESVIRSLVSRSGWVNVLSSLARHLTLTVLLFTQ